MGLGCSRECCPVTGAGLTCCLITVVFVVNAFCIPAAHAKDGLEEVIIGMANEEWSSAFMDLVVGFAATAFTGISALVVYYLTQDRPLDPKEKANQTYEKLKTELKRDPCLTFRWCQANGLVADICPLCDKTLDVGDSTKGGQQLKCTKCRKPVPALQGTWFENIDIDPWKAICVLYHWGVGNTHRNAAFQLALDEDTIKQWYKKCQEAAEYNLRLCSNAKRAEEEETVHLRNPLGRYHYQDEHIACYCPKYRIGGKGRIVEVDILERGELLQEKYVLAAVERGGWRSFAIPLPDRGAKTVKAVLKTKVFPGTVVKGALEEEVQATNELRCVRALIRDLLDKMAQPVSEDMIPVYLTQWMWRKIHEHNRIDVFTQMVDHVSRAFPFTPGDSSMRRNASAFCKPPEEEEEVCTQLIIMPNKPPIINKFLKEKEEPVQEEESPQKPPLKKKPGKVTYRKPRARPLKQRTTVRVAPRPQIYRTPPPGAVPSRAY